MEYRYIIGKNNQLLFQEPKTKKLIPAKGKFALTGTNQLVYFVQETSAWRKKYGFSDIIRLKGECITAEGDTLVFQITAPSQPPSQAFSLFKLSGSWFANEYNQLCFAVKKETSPDILTFQGEWGLNKNQQITYSFERKSLTRRTKAVQAVALEGFWEINSADKLTYILSGATDSRFDFRGQIESRNLYPQDGVIKYRLGAGLKGDSSKKASPKIICLYGAWKFGKKFGLNFEIDYGRGRMHPVEFGTKVNLNKEDTVEFSLTDRRNRLLGVTVTFTHRFLKKLDASAFLRIKKISPESGIEAGVKIPF